MNIKNLSVATKIWLPPVITAVLMALIAVALGLRTSATISAEQHEAELQRERLQLATHWQGLSEVNAARTLAVLVSRDATMGETLRPDIARTVEESAQLQKRLVEISTTPAAKAALEAIKLARDQHVKVRDQLLGDREAGNLEADGAQQYQAAFAAYQKAQAHFVEVTGDDVREAAAANRAARMRTVYIAAGALFGMSLLICVTALLNARAIVRPLREAAAATDRVAAGDLTVRLDTRSHDEVGQLVRGLQRMTESLRSLIGEVRSGAQNIEVASREIATGNADLSSRTEQTASALQETASSMQQLTGTVAQSADAASQASQLASTAAHSAERGGEVVAEVVRSMADISGASRKIGDIIGVIDGIAFQTNILALNAAVEAARAGEQGRGFAVVASEVRSLAQRSAEAAKEIKGLIGASVDKVEAGTRLVEGAGTSMGEIVGSVRRVSNIIGEISTGAHEQRDGIGQVNGAVMQLDQMTQQNAALVEQSAAAAESMRQQAQRLAEVVATFRLHA